MKQLSFALVLAMSLPAWAADDLALARRRGIEVVAHKLYPKERRFEVGLLAGVIPNDAFFRYFPLGLRLSHHFGERIAAELQFSYLLSTDTELRSFLQENDADLDARSRDRQQLRVDASANWSPLYGKFAAGKRIFHLEGYLLAGGGIVRTFVDPDRESLKKSSIAPEGAFGLGLRVFLSKRISLRLEYRQYVYLRPTPASGVDAGLGTPSELTLGASALLGGS